MSETIDQNVPSPADGDSDTGLYDRSVADDSKGSKKSEDEPAVVESNSSNYGGSAVVGEQGD